MFIHKKFRSHQIFITGAIHGCSIIGSQPECNNICVVIYDYKHEYGKKI